MGARSSYAERDSLVSTRLDLIRAHSGRPCLARCGRVQPDRQSGDRDGVRADDAEVARSADAPSLKGVPEWMNGW